MPKPVNDANGPAPIEAIDRALTLLMALAQAGSQGQSLVGLCRDLDMNKSTAYRALMTMRARGFVTHDSDGNYCLGPTAINLGAGYLGSESIGPLVHPALVVLAKDLDELVHLGVLNGDQVVYVDKVEPAKSIRVWSQVGNSVPAATTSLGRAILAYTPIDRDQLDAFVPSDSDVRLSAVLAQARRRGYATEIEENEPGIACIGVPILSDNSVVAALSVTMLTLTLDDQRIEHIVDRIATLVPPRLPDYLHLPAELTARARRS